MEDGREEGKAEGIHWLGGFAMQVNFDCGLLFPVVVFEKVIRGQHSWYLLETAALCVIVSFQSAFWTRSILPLLFPITSSRALLTPWA